MVRGYKGTGQNDRVLSCIKHFAGGEFSQGGINASPVDISEFWLEHHSQKMYFIIGKKYFNEQITFYKNIL